MKGNNYKLWMTRSIRYSFYHSTVIDVFIPRRRGIAQSPMQPSRLNTKAIAIHFIEIG